MEILKAVEMVEAVVNGTNPITGEAIPENSHFNSPEIIRALFTCTQHIKHPPPKSQKTLEERQAENQRKGLPKNVGLPWTNEMRAKLAESFKSGESMRHLAATFERTRNAIVLELQKQGLVSEDNS